jgi:hypothetical protein
MTASAVMKASATKRGADVGRHRRGQGFRTLPLVRIEGR